MDAAAGDEPLVLVGMSSTYMDHADVLQRAPRRLARCAASRAPRSRRRDRRARERHRRRARPHREVLRHAAAVLTHAGHGTVIKSLAAGVPVVAMPLGRDQLDNAARVEHHGAGLRLKPKASAEAIASSGAPRHRRAVLPRERRAAGRRDRGGDGGGPGGEGAGGAGGGAAERRSPPNDGIEGDCCPG